MPRRPGSFCPWQPATGPLWLRFRLRTPGCAVTSRRAGLTAPRSPHVASRGAALPVASGSGGRVLQHGGGGAGGGARRAGRGVARPGPLSPDRQVRPSSSLAQLPSPSGPPRGRPRLPPWGCPLPARRRRPAAPALPRNSLPMEAPPRASLSGGAPLCGGARPCVSPAGFASCQKARRDPCPGPHGDTGARSEVADSLSTAACVSGPRPPGLASVPPRTCRAHAERAGPRAGLGGDGCDLSSRGCLLSGEDS